MSSDSHDLAWYLDRLVDVEGPEVASETYPKNWKAFCPCHDDVGTSMKGLSITVEKKGGPILIHCHSCKISKPDVDVALNGHDPSDWVPTVKAKSVRGTVEKVYGYVDEEGHELFQVVRYKDPKGFSQRHKVNGRWVYNLKDVRRVLYRLPEVIEAVANGQEVWVVEGEKDADRLSELGLVATCNPMGAGNWDDSYANVLRGARVTIIQDRDEHETGAHHARDIKRSLIGVAQSVGVYEALTGKDVSEHLDAGHTIDQLVPADRFPRVDLGQVIEEGIDPPPFLIDGVIYEGRSHALLGEPGDGKTLVMLALAVAVLREQKTVAWFDEENGPSVIASRLVALGATADEVREFFAYYPFTEPTLKDADELVEEMRVLAASLVVFDSGADFYAVSDLNENDNMDMTKWALAFSQRLSRALSIASVVLEHVAKSGDGSYQRGAGAKKAKVDASWRLEVLAPFDHETVGEVELVRAKDRLAHLKPRLRYRIGGDGGGTTVFEQVEVEDVEAQILADVKQKQDAFRDATVRVLRDGSHTTKATGLSQRSLTGLLPPAPQKFKNELVQYIASDPRNGVRKASGEKYNSIVYWLEEGASDV